MASQKNAANEKGPQLRYTHIGYPYRPSVTPLADLKPMTISELRLETHHKGRVLIVRTFTPAVRVTSVQTAIEDGNLDVNQMCVCNVDLDARAADVLPKGAIFAIKEPYYISGPENGYIVRIDHPSDLHRLTPAHPQVPFAFAPRVLELDAKADDVAFGFKADGNTAYKKKKYLSAVEAYTQGLGTCSAGNITLRRDLHRNRSIANFYLQRYEVAAKDAVDALHPSTAQDEKKAQENVKAMYRAGRAFYHLQEFSQAQAYFENLLKLAPNDKDGQEQLEKTEARLVEAIAGTYDFAAMSSLITPSHKRLDHASFTVNVEVRSAGHKGRGLFATKNIKSGDLILVKTAFDIAFESEMRGDTYLMLNLNTGRGRIGSHALLYHSLIQKMLYNPTQAKRLLQLHDEGYSPKCTAEMVDGVASIDTHQVGTIMEHNCFACPNTLRR